MNLTYGQTPLQFPDVSPRLPNRPASQYPEQSAEVSPEVLPKVPAVRRTGTHASVGASVEQPHHGTESSTHTQKRVQSHRMCPHTYHTVQSLRATTHARSQGKGDMYRSPGHEVQAPDPAGLNVPGGHVATADSVQAVGHANPAGQIQHRVDPGPLYCPAGQGIAVALLVATGHMYPACPNKYRRRTQINRVQFFGHKHRELLRTKSSEDMQVCAQLDT